jgi:hypothetical protein
VGVIRSAVEVELAPLNVEDADAGFIELPDAEPLIPPVAPAPSMRERAIFSLVQAIV